MYDTTPRRARRRASLGLGSVLSVLSALAAAPLVAQDSKRPNILFVFSDDHAPHAIGAYGTRYADLDPTPQIDALARQGVLFRHSFCTNSICGPSRAVIQTGLHSHRNGFRKNGDRFDGSQQTFPKMLQAAGYRTAVIGKWHLGSDPQGFDHWDVLPGQGAYYNPELKTADGTRQVEGYCTDIITDLALAWLEEQRDRAPEQPFVLMCQHKGPHRTWMPPLRYLDLWEDEELPEPATLFDRHEDDASPARSVEMGIDRHMELVYDLFLTPDGQWNPAAGSALDRSGYHNLARMTDAQRTRWDDAFAAKNAAFRAADLRGDALVRWKYQRYLKNYLRTAKAVDDSVGRLLAYLDESGLAENTVVVYSSDQGFYLGDHGWYDKRWMYEESLAMPLIVRWPGVAAPGTEVAQMVQNLDYAQTFLELAGVEAPAAMQGRSLVPLLRGETPADWRRSIYYHYHGFPDVHRVARHYGIRTERYKLLRFYQLGEWELYDLQEDPDELNNVYADPRYREVAIELAEELGFLRAHYGDDSDVSLLPAEERRALGAPR